MDFRGQDLSASDFKEMADLFPTFTFDSATQWPSAEKMPSGVEPGKLTEDGKYLGLGLSDLHSQGITGKGVSVAVIDKPILEDHEEFPDNLVYIEVQENHPNAERLHFHGAAVAGILAGKHGVAPGSRLYYFAVPDDLDPYARYAEAMDRLLEVQKTLKDAEKIRVVAVAYSIDPYEFGEGAAKLREAIRKAEEQGIIIVYPGMGGLEFTGAGCLPGKDRDKPENYQLWSWTWAKGEVIAKAAKANLTSWEAFRKELIRLLTQDPDLDSLQAEAIHTYIYLTAIYKDSVPFKEWFSAAAKTASAPEPKEAKEWSGVLAVPCDYLTVPDVNGRNSYTYYGAGGLSWSVPYVAGLLALGLQVNPNATSEGLFNALRDTAVPSGVHSYYGWRNAMRPGFVYRNLAFRLEK